LDLHGVEQAVIGGLSLGGDKSPPVHPAHPPRGKTPMLFDTRPGDKRDEPPAGGNKTAGATPREERTQGLAAPGPSAPALHRHHPSAKGLACAARGMLAQRDARVINSVEAIKVPTLVLAGAKDEPFLAATDYMASKIPGAQKVLIPDAGHAANIDQPEAFNRAV